MNNFPISVSQIAEGMTNASSALAAAGNTFDQSVALLTAANTTIQNAAKASTGLRTIAARLRNTKTELDDLGEAMTEGTYEELVSALTKYNVALRDSAGEFRSTYDIIADIAKVWDKMSTTEQAGLATAVSGTRQQAIFFSLVEQFREASGAMEDMANSAGTLEESYGIYMESVTAHVNQLKAAFQGLGQETFTKEFLTDIVDLGTTLVNIAGAIMDVVNKLGGLNTVLYTTLGILATVNAQAILAQVKKLLGFFPKLISFVTRLGQAVPIAISLFREGDLAAMDVAPTALGKITTALQAVGISASAAQIAVGAFVAALGVVLLAVSAHNRAMEEARQRAEEAARAYETTVSSIDGYKEKIAELKRSLDEGNLSQEEAYNARKELLGIQDEIRDAYGKEAEAIDLIGDSAEESARKLNGLTKELARENLVKNDKDIQKAISKLEGAQEWLDIDLYSETMGSGLADDEIIKRIREVIRKYKEIAAEEWVTGSTISSPNLNIKLTADVDSAKETITDLALDFKELRKQLVSEGKDLTGTFLASSDFNRFFSDAINKVDETIKDYGEIYDKQIQWKLITDDNYSDAMEKINGAGEALQEALAAGDEEALAAAVEKINALALDPEQIDDAGVRKYMEELIAQMQAEALKYTVNVKLAADVDTDDWTRRVKAALGTLAGEDGVVTATDIRDAGITARVESENPSQNRGYISAETQAWNELAMAAEEYGTDVEWLIPLLEQYGYLTKSTTDEIEGETGAAEDLADALSKVGDVYELLGKAQSDMGGGGGLSSDTALAIVKELTEAGEDYTKYLTEENGVLKLNTKAWNEYIAAKTRAAGAEPGSVQGAVVNSIVDEAALTRLDEARDRLEELQKALEGLDGAEENDVDALETLEGLLPGITTRVNSVKDAQKLLNEAIARQKEAAAEAYAEYVWGAENSVFADEDRCKEILAENQGLTDALNKSYGVDRANWADLAKDKWVIDKSLVGSLSELWQKYHNVSTEELEDSIRVMEEDDVTRGLYDEEKKELNDMKAALAARKELARQWQELNDAINGAGSGKSGSGSKGVEAYIADIDRFREAVEALRKAQEDRERVEGSIEDAGSYERKIQLEQELISAYKSEQEALHALNDARDEAIAEGAESLRALGFAVQYNADTNELWIDNLEHLNELTAKSRGKYDSLQEATNGLRKETEELIGTITDLNEANREGSKSWLEVEKSIREAMLAVFEMRRSAGENALTLNENWQENAIEGYDYDGIRQYTENMIAQRRAMQEELHKEAEYYRSLGYSDTSDEVSRLSDLWWDYEREIGEAVATAWGEVVDNASSAVDEIQEVYDVLHEAADEFAANGFITVDTFQSIVGLGAQYMRYLTDENGLLKINHDSIDAVIAAKTQELAMNEALAYVERLRAALQDENIKQLQELLYATTEAAGGTWGLVYANLALLDLDDGQYEAALHNINAIRSLADAAVSGIGHVAGSVSNDLQDMKAGLDDILKYVMDMLKQRIQDQIDALEDMKDAYADLIDLRKESLKSAEKEGDYQDEVAEKTRELAKLQERIDALGLDNSRDAAAQRAKLEEEMAELQKELADLQADHARETQEDALDDMQKAYEAEKDGEIEALEESISSTEKLYRMAIDYIRSNWETLKDELIQWNYEVGTNFQYDIENAWDAALRAAQRYGDYVTALGSIDADINAASGSTHNDYVGTGIDPKEEAIHNIIREMWANANAWFDADEKGRERLNQRNLDLGSRLAAYGIDARRDNGTWYVGDELLFEKYKKYLYHKGGIAGDRPTLKQNEVLAVLEKGEPVLDKKKEAGLFRLVDFTTDLMNRFSRLTAARGAEDLFRDVRRPVPEVSGPFPEGKRGTSVQFGDVYIYGADDGTVEKHREINRRFVNDVIKQLGLKR